MKAVGGQMVVYIQHVRLKLHQVSALSAAMPRHVPMVTNCPNLGKGLMIRRTVAAAAAAATVPGRAFWHF